MSMPEPDDWRGRDEAVCSLATRHVVCTRHFFPFFPSKQTAYRRVQRLVDRKQLKKVGEVMIQDSGRPESVYCNGWKPKIDQLRHEILLTDFLLLYPDVDTVRGWKYVDQTIRPDAEILTNNRRFFVELDTGHMSLGQVQRRQQVYRNTTDLVLYVTPMTSRRVNGLIRVSTLIEQVGLFTTLQAVMNDPTGNVWLNCQREQLRLVL